MDADTIRANADPLRQRSYGPHRLDGKSFDRIPEGTRSLVTNNLVFGYLADRFRLRVIGRGNPLCTTLASPSSADLRSLTEAMVEGRRAHPSSPTPPSPKRIDR
ncbi:hypothetical protein GCM10023238_09100 [Streptomyces heliomycini]